MRPSSRAFASALAIAAAKRGRCRTSRQKAFPWPQLALGGVPGPQVEDATALELTEHEPDGFAAAVLPPFRDGD